MYVVDVSVCCLMESCVDDVLVDVVIVVFFFFAFTANGLRNVVEEIRRVLCLNGVFLF